MDLIIFIVLMAIIIIVFKDFKCLVYFVGIVEILFRILTFIRLHIGVPEISALIAKYIPTSILDIFARYSNGLFYEILAWAFLACFVVLEVYLIKYFFKRK